MLAGKLTSGVSCCWIWLVRRLCHCCHKPSVRGAAPVGTPQLSAHDRATPTIASKIHSSSRAPMTCTDHHGKPRLTQNAHFTRDSVNRT